MNVQWGEQLPDVVAQMRDDGFRYAQRDGDELVFTGPYDGQLASVYTTVPSEAGLVRVEVVIFPDPAEIDAEYARLKSTLYLALGVPPADYTSDARPVEPGLSTEGRDTTDEVLEETFRHYDVAWWPHADGGEVRSQITTAASISIQYDSPGWLALKAKRANQKYRADA